MLGPARLVLALGCLAWSLGCESKSDTVAGAGAATSLGGEPATGGNQGGASGGAHAAAAGGAPGGAGAAAGGAPNGGATGGMMGNAGSANTNPLPGTPIVFVASSGGGGAIRTYDLDKETGALAQRGSDFDTGTNPTYLALNPARTHLYATDADAGGGVTALGIAGDGVLTLLNQVAGSDGGFTHLALDPSGKLALAACWEGGSVSVFPVGGDGSLAAEIANLDFGDGSQAHAIAFDQSGERVLVPTMGTDQIQQLVLAEDGTLSPNAPAFVDTAAGAAPRHIAVHSSFKLVFVVNEVDSTVTPYELSAQGTLTPGTSVSTLPAGFAGENTGAHIEVSPDGRFVYASNRGHDSIVVYGVDQSSGALTLIEHEPTRGSTPRDFDMDPNGETLVVANQQSDTLSVYAIEPDGTLTPLGTPTPSGPSPRAVQFHYLPP